MQKILIIGDAVVPSGFARVIRSIFEPLQNEFELHQLATRHAGGAHDYAWELYPAAKGQSVYGYDQILPLIKKIEPDLVFLLYDIPFQIPYLQHLRQAIPKPRIVIYSPVEAGPIAPEIVRQLHGVSRYVMYTEYGRRQIADALTSILEDDPGFEFPDLEVIPHGVDTHRFYPLGGSDRSIAAARLEARQAMRLDDAEHLESFIVLNANRNMPRKRIDLTMQGFAEFAKDKPANVKLYLHMAVEDTGWNVAILAKRYGIFDRLIMTQADNRRPDFSDEQMNLLYNACDVGITTTTGEGWGMVSFEHAATRAAQIVPRHTSLAELWRDAAEFIEPVMKLTYPGNLTEGYIVNPAGVAAALQRLYEDEARRTALAQAAYLNATRPDLDWISIAARWKQLFIELTEDR
ncbi:MAG: D-inositol-3-phosphate glycosyltransferase [Blastocatellia bacterium]|nr:D-inositol-3-phosphate glycosyltransferase [Blastocatellia bacterium]